MASVPTEAGDGGEDLAGLERLVGLVRAAEQPTVVLVDPPGQAVVDALLERAEPGALYLAPPVSPAVPDELDLVVHWVGAGGEAVDEPLDALLRRLVAGGRYVLVGDADDDAPLARLAHRLLVIVGHEPQAVEHVRVEPGVVQVVAGGVWRKRQTVDGLVGDIGRAALAPIGAT